MAFTDRFIKVEVILYNTKEAEMIGYNNDTASDISYIKIYPEEITFYRPARSDEKSDDWDNTLIFFNNGESFHANLTIEEFENLLNKYIK